MIPAKDQLDRKAIASILADAIETTEHRYRIGEISLAHKLHRLTAIRDIANAIGIKPSEIGR